MNMIVVHLTQGVVSNWSDMNYNHNTWIQLSRDSVQYHVIGRSVYGTPFTDTNGKVFIHGLRKWGKKERSFVINYLNVINIIRKVKATHIIVQCPINGGLLAVLLSKIYKFKILTEVHGYHYINYYDSRSKLCSRLLFGVIKYVFRNSNKVRMLNKSMLNHFTERGVLANYTILPVRVDYSIFNEAKPTYSIVDIPTIVSVGNLVPVKNHELLIKAICHIRRKVDLIIIGNGPLRNEYEELWKLNGALGDLILPGQLDQVNVKRLLLSSDIYVHSSKSQGTSEGTPRAILEAMALGLPVVSTNVGAISGMINNNETGILVDADNILELSKAIEMLLDNENTRVNIGTNARKLVKKEYDSEVVFEEYRNILSSL